MSYWIYRKGPEGRRNLYLVEFPMLVVMALFGLMAAFGLPRYLEQPSRLYRDGAILISMGCVLVLSAKIHLFRKGIWVSWGSRLMTRSYRVVYRVGYAGLIVGIAITAMALFAGV